MKWREVSCEDFYAAIGPLDVNPHIVNNEWPYSSDFVTRSGQVAGKAIEYLPEGSALPATRYMLPVRGEA